MASGYRRKRFYPTSQRILVHLSGTPGTYGPSVLPTLTQEGIGSAIRSGRSTATKWALRMEASGLLRGERAHVPGHRVRKTVYRLTEAGWEEARRLRRLLDSHVVHVTAPGMGDVPMRVTEVPRLFPDLIDITSTVCLVREGRLDLRPLARDRKAALPPLLWGETLRRTDRVFGRQDEVRSLAAWVVSRTPILAVVGLAGIGKSVLVASWIQRHRPRPFVFWTELEEGTTPTALLAEFAQFLARLGRRTLLGALAEDRLSDPAFLTRLLSHEFHELPVLAVLDNFHLASAAVAKLVSGPLLAACRATRVRAVLISRTVPAIASGSSGRRPARAHVLRIPGLDLESSVSLLRAKGLAADDVTAMRIAESARGHPMVLSLAAQTGSEVESATRRYLEKEIWAALSPAERQVLETSCAFRRFAPLEALKAIDGADDSVLASLESKNLIEPTLAEGYVVHDTIREYVRALSGEDRRRELPRIVARYFLNRADPRERIEGFYHLVQAGDLGEAADRLSAEASSLVESASARDLAALFAGGDAQRLNPSTAGVVSEVLGDGMRVSGHSVPAIQQYLHAIRAHEASGREEFVPRVLHKIAAIERQRNEYDKALGHLVEARARLLQRPDPAQLAEVLKELALIEKIKGNFGEARMSLNAAVDLATESSEAGVLSRCLLVLGTLEAETASLERGLHHKMESLRIADRAGNVTEASRACISIGTTLWEMGRLEESLTFEQRGLHLARLVGNLRLTGYGLMDKAAVLVDLGRFEEADSVFQEAKSFFTILEERDSLALLAVAEGQREMRMGRIASAKRTWERAVDELRAVGDPGDLVRTLRWVGGTYLDLGELANGRSLLLEALRHARALGNPSIIAEIEGQMGSPRRAAVDVPVRSASEN